MTDRDTFAAAALTGLLAQGDDGSFSEESYARAAYRWADAMLRERGDHIPDAGKMAETPGEGSVPDSRTANEPVAWVAWFDFEDKPDADFLFRNKEQADCWCRKRGADSVPLYLHPAPAVTAEPVAWWLRGTEYETGCEYEYVSLVRESADAAAKEGGTVTPLYRSPTLTDEERAAVEWCIFQQATPQRIAVTLRKMLERLGGD